MRRGRNIRGHCLVVMKLCYMSDVSRRVITKHCQAFVVRLS